MSPPLEFRTLRPRLRGDSTILRTRQGVIFENDTQSFGLAGDLYPLVTALRPLLDGQTSCEEILQAVPEEIRQGVADLLRLLLDRTILVAQSDESAVILPEPVRRRFAEQVECLTHFCARPVAAFHTFRSSRVLLAGLGPAYAAAAAALPRYGLARLDLLPAAPETALDELAAVLGELESEGVEAACRTLSREQLGDGLREYSLVLYLSDRSAFRDLVWLNRECARVQCPLLPAVVFGDRSLLGPVLEPPLGCWVCGLCRQAEDLLSPAQAEEFHRDTYPEDRVFVAEPAPLPEVARLLGRDTAFEAFKLLSAGRRAQSRLGVLLTRRDGDQSYQSDLLPYPLAGCTRYCQPFCRG